MKNKAIIQKNQYQAADKIKYFNTKYENHIETFSMVQKQKIYSRYPLSAHSNDKVEMVVEERLGTDT